MSWRLDLLVVLVGRMPHEPRRLKLAQNALLRGIPRWDLWRELRGRVEVLLPGHQHVLLSM
jgi:hypothetical protein